MIQTVSRAATLPGIDSLDGAVGAEDTNEEPHEPSAESWRPVVMARASQQWSRSRGWSSDDLG
jgi:hypothetical protein